MQRVLDKTTFQGIPRPICASKLLSPKKPKPRPYIRGQRQSHRNLSLNIINETP